MKAACIFLMMFAVSACSGKPHVVEPDAGSDSTPTSRLYLVDHGRHVGLAIAADEVNPVMPDLKERFTGAQYYEFGWGDQKFYPAEEITLGLTLQAILWSRGVVVHVVALPVSPLEYFNSGNVTHTCLSPEEMDSLMRYLSGSFKRGAGNDLVELQPGLYGDSQFYQGVGRYHLLNTSNKWAAKALKSAGMDITPAFKLTAESVITFVEDNRSDCALNSPLR